MAKPAPDRDAKPALTDSMKIALAYAILALIAATSGCGADADPLREIRALQDAGRFEESIAELRTVLAESPNLPEANYRLGVALARTGNPSRSIWALEKASESGAFATRADLLLASVHFELDNFEESIRASERVLAVDPDHQEALRRRARAHVGARQLEAALLDTRRLLERDPDDFETLVTHATVLAELGRTREAEVAHARIKLLGESSGDADRAARGCLAPALFAKEDLGDIERAEALYEDCASKYPGSGFAIDHIARFFEVIGKGARAIELLRRAVDEEPASLPLHFALAAYLARHGSAEEAERVLAGAVERFGIEAAGIPLARHYRQQHDSARALEVLEELASRTGDTSDSLRFVRADLLVDVGELDRAAEIADRLEEASYASMIRGRISLARGDARSALAELDAGIARWPDNAGARYLAGIAAMQLGDFERAIAELRESVRVDASATEAARVLARLQLERREYALALAFSAIARSRGSAGGRAADLELEARALTALGEFDAAREAIRALGALPGREGEAAAALAAVERSASGAAAAIAAIEELDLDLREPANEAALRALAQDLVAADGADRAVDTIGRALLAHPERASLHALMGTALARAHRPADARSAFERALQIDPDQPEALGGLAALAGSAGDTRRAVELFDRAARGEPDNQVYAYAAAQLLLAAGDRSAAEARLRAIVSRSPGQPGARNDLAWLLATDGRELDLALSLAEDASRLQPEPATLDTLGLVHLARGENEQAIFNLEKAASARDSSPSVRYHLAIALIRSGDVERARAMLDLALAAGEFPEAHAAREWLAKLDRS